MVVPSETVNESGGLSHSVHQTIQEVLKGCWLHAVRLFPKRYHVRHVTVIMVYR